MTDETDKAAETDETDAKLDECWGYRRPYHYSNTTKIRDDFRILCDRCELRRRLEARR
jgi:hypothetical protein